MPYVKVQYETQVFACKDEETGNVAIFLDFLERKKLYLRLAMTKESAEKLAQQLNDAAKIPPTNC